MADYDLAIIGGGINGAGIARDAAGRGLKVLLVEQGDLASGTSSASSKLVHGGLRYTVGTNPFVADRPRDLLAALSALAAAEHGHGPPALSPVPAAGNETWGGRKTVFGSPWNYGSRLTVDEVLALLAATLGLRLA